MGVGGWVHNPADSRGCWGGGGGGGGGEAGGGVLGYGVPEGRPGNGITFEI